MDSEEKKYEEFCYLGGGHADIYILGGHRGVRYSVDGDNIIFEIRRKHKNVLERREEKR